MIACFGDADVMIIPAMPVLPPKSGTMILELGGRTVHVAQMLTRFTSPINFCGFPALSMPCGKSVGGLPVNLQVVGRPGADATVLRVARWCEQVLSS
jgi:aspartyl-tRNA(Asn)/glutamyl-tRNA(Gln) amidotransferase subunit A